MVFKKKCQCFLSIYKESQRYPNNTEHCSKYLLLCYFPVAGSQTRLQPLIWLKGLFKLLQQVCALSPLSLLYVSLCCVWEEAEFTSVAQHSQETLCDFKSLCAGWNISRTKEMKIGVNQCSWNALDRGASLPLSTTRWRKNTQLLGKFLVCLRNFPEVS